MTKGNLQIQMQSLSLESINGIFHRTRTKLKKSNCQNNLEKKKSRAGRFMLRGFRLLQTYSHQNNIALSKQDSTDIKTNTQINKTEWRAQKQTNAL